MLNAPVSVSKKTKQTNLGLLGLLGLVGAKREICLEVCRRKKKKKRRRAEGGRKEGWMDECNAITFRP